MIRRWDLRRSQGPLAKFLGRDWEEKGALLPRFKVAVDGRRGGLIASQINSRSIAPGQ